MISVFSRPGCHLCEVLIEELLLLVDDRVDVEVLNVDSRTDWQERYGTEVPVVLLDGREICRHRLDETTVITIQERLAKVQELP